MQEWITVIAALAYVAVSLIGLSKKRGVSYASWTVSSLSFLIIALALALMGLDALKLPVTPYLGSLYPAFLAVGIIAIGYKWWKHYLAFTILMLILIGIGSITAPLLKTVAQVGLHAISGLIIIILPVLLALKDVVKKSFAIVSLGGITIGVGGMALAALAAGKPILPLNLVIMLLHPLLFISAFLIAAGIYVYQKQG